MSIDNYIKQSLKRGRVIPVYDMHKTTGGLARAINKAYLKHGFKSAFIYAEQGAGKTTYGMLTLYQVYDDWDKVIQHTYFEPESLIEDLKKSFEENTRIKAVLLDDISLWLIRFSYREKFNVWFSKLYNLLRSLTSGVIMTSVELTDIVKFIRDKVIYRIPILVRNEFVEARAYRVYTSPKLEKYVKKVFFDRYTYDMIPQKIRNYYEEKRREAIARLFQELEEIKGSQYEKEISVYTKTLDEQLDNLLDELSRDYPML